MIYTNPLINSISKIVEHVLKGLEMYSLDALDLVMRTGMQESKFKHLEQLGEGPALGFFQTEPGMTGAEDAWYNYLAFREGLRNKLALLGIPKGPWDEFTLMSNIALQVALCRIKYRRDPNPIPSTIEGQATYYKRVYNTHLGAATIEDFIANATELEKLQAPA